MNEQARAQGHVAYGGYYQTWAGQGMPELTRVGPGTPCGNYLRRYWQPVALAREVTDIPRLIRVLGEDLVLFREPGGRYGLVHRNCPHRRASMEYAVCEGRGIRCAYHGWLFDVDGTVLEVPGQPDGVEARIQSTVTLGAYRVREHHGLIFAYMGPPDLEPEFPIYDTMEIPDQVMVAYRAPFHCNWLQVTDGILDPIHTAFLHSRISRAQFSEGFGVIGEMKFYERPLGFLGSATRRVGDNVWVRINELVLPNFTQAGAAFATDGTKQRYFGRTAFSRWVVPVDDEETTCFAWANFGDRADPPSYNTPEGPELIEQGERFDRPYEEKQRYPADAEATEGMGRITEHDKENLVPSDKGIVRMRLRLKQIVKALEDGKEPDHAGKLWSKPIPTYGGDTVLNLPKNGGDDHAYLRAIGQAVMDAHFEADRLRGAERDTTVIERLKVIEKNGGQLEAS